MTASTFLHYLQQKRLFTAWVVNTLLFGAVVLWGCPVYHSGDEVNMLQTLSGGYGVPASPCLPFLHYMHFFLNIPLTALFAHFPGTNWFSLFMLLGQYLSCIAICYVLLCRHGWMVALLSYLVLFLVFETWMVLYLHTSSTSMVCALAGLALLWHALQQRQLSAGMIASGVLLVLLGALFRMHTLLPVVVVPAPFFLLLPGLRRMAGAAGLVAGCGIVVLLLLQWQQQYYRHQYAAWEQEEQYRRAKYNYINYRTDTSRAALAPYRLEVAMTENLLLFDTILPSAKTLNTLALAARTSMPASRFFSVSTWYWHFINNRLFLLALVLPFLLFAFARTEKLVVAGACIAALGLISYLMLYRKMPEFMIPGALFVLFLFTLLSGTYKTVTSRSVVWLQGILITGLLAWGAVRCYKMNRQNALSFQAFKLIYHELASQPDKLFINTGDGDPFTYFYCFATPQQYPFRNILFIDHPVSSRMPYLLPHFGLHDLKEAPFSNKVYFRGPESPALQQYYEKVLQRPVSYTDTIPGFHYSLIRKIIVR